MLFGNPAVEFSIVLGGNFLTALVLEELEAPETTYFRVKFSDGFEDLFYLDDKAPIAQGTSPKSKLYATAIRHDLIQVINLDHNLFYHVFQHEMRGITFNVWVEEARYNNKPVYLVSYNGDFHFGLVKQHDTWQPAGSVEELSAAESVLIKRIGYLLEALL